jgi:hypothetical protein
VTDVTFADVQPVFAYRDPKLYFVPEGVQVVRNLPLAPQTGTGIKTPRQPAPTEARAAVEFLRYRRDNLRAIIERTRGEFRGIREWSLFP